MSMRNNGLAACALRLAACAPATYEQAGAMGNGANGADGAAVVRFSDANVAATATAANLMEIRPSELALQRAQNAQVREYAQRMITEHTNLQRQMEQLLASKGMAPADNAFSATMKRNLDPAMEMLQSRSGAEFDREYVLHMISSHMNTLHTLDTTLIPATTDPDMRQMLTGVVRPAVAGHLQQIKQIHQSMQHAM